MATYSNPQSYGGSPERYNPKVQERKQQSKTDWAELVRYHQAVAAQMVQQEREKRMLQQHEFRTANEMLMDEKNIYRNMERQAKQQEGMQAMTSKEEFEQYLLKAKNDKNEFQKAITAEYDREKHDREEMLRNMANNDRQIGQKIVYQALDSLDREREMREKKKNELIYMTDQTLREAEERRRREQEYIQQNRQEHNRLMEQNSYNQSMKELNYKLYYQRISDKQSELQQSYDRKAGHEERCRDNHVDDFVKKGIVDATRKAMEEDMRRQVKRDEQFKSTLDDVRSRIEHHEQEKMHQKQEYQQSLQQRMQREQELEEQNILMKQLKATQITDYKSTLEHQVRETEDQKRRMRENMTDYEKNMVLQNYENALLPGLRSSKFDSLIAPQLKTTGNFSGSRFVPMPHFSGSARESANFERTVDPNQFDSPTQTHQMTNSYSVSASMPSPSQAYYGNNYGMYNPITNPVPNNLQNPYLVKEFQKGGFNPRNYLAVMADKHLIAATNAPNNVPQ